LRPAIVYSIFRFGAQSCDDLFKSRFLHALLMAEG
jgi:hypothetical protein